MTDPKWLTEARKEIGTREGIGAKDNPKVLQYFIEASHPEIKHDEVAWCAAFVNAMLKRGNVKGNGSLAARSFESWGQPCPGNKPVYGCIGVKRRSGPKPPPGLGHVGIVVGANATHIFMVSGNAQDRVGIDAYKRSEFTAFRYPANIPIPKEVLLPSTIAGASVVTKEA